MLVEKSGMVIEPIADQSSTMETYIIPNYNILRLLGPSWLSCFMLDNGTIETVEEIQEILCVVRAQGCMMVENPMMTDGSAQRHIAPTLTRDLHNGTASNNVPPPSSF